VKLSQLANTIRFYMEENQGKEVTKLKLTVCPTCGNKNLKKVRKAVTGTRQGKRYSARDVEFYECPDCGERIYDSSALQQIEQHSNVGTKRRSARRLA